MMGTSNEGNKLATLIFLISIKLIPMAINKILPIMDNALIISAVRNP